MIVVEEHVLFTVLKDSYYAVDIPNCVQLDLPVGCKMLSVLVRDVGQEFSVCLYTEEDTENALSAREVIAVRTGEEFPKNKDYGWTLLNSVVIPSDSDSEVYHIYVKVV